MAVAISRGVPTRPIGIVASISSRVAGSRSPAAVMSVATTPGRTALTRIPSAATSLAKPTVKASTAALLAA